jgi:hypothetical protein
LASEDTAASKFFEDNFGLPWTWLDCMTKDTQLNERALTRIKGSTDTLLQNYTQKCVFLEGVHPGDALYTARAELTGAALAEANVTVNELLWEAKQMKVVLPSASITHMGVALAKYGQGLVGYVGGTDGREGTNKAFLAMCGLQDS